MVEKNRILVVDDNRSLCNLIKDILEMEQYDVSVAYDGFSALEAAKEQQFDVVLMDIKMPVMNGVETFKKLKSISPGTPTIMVTAFAVEDLIREALREGAYAALYKPLDFDQLLGTLTSASSDKAFVLLVDDEKDHCAALHDVLDDNEYRVAVVHDGETAIEKTRTNDFDIIILDMKLPTLNGLDTYLAIREIRPDVGVVFITGYPDDMGGLAQLAVEKKAHACIEKPLDMNRFIPMLNGIMEQRRQK